MTMTSEHPSDMPIQIASSELVTADIEALADWYGSALGFEALEENGARIVLGLGGSALLTLIQDPNAKPTKGTATGLFHNAYVVPNRSDLAAFLGHARRTGLRLTGASDHLVTEAVYLDDPDGNGIEIYWDRPRAAWPLGPGGEIRMATEPLDLDALMAELSADGGSPLPAGTRLGHIHLKVADLAAAERFVGAALGFAKQVDYPGAGFFGSGGYHHHVGANIWHSRGGKPAPQGSTGLRSYTVVYADVASRDAAAARLEDQSFERREESGRLGYGDISGGTVWLETL
ncbi:VOC family protein [Fulvimarina sp. MAC3]|uniref:VOC family protein n=1 Tax=Fulvimarina sp. MAC3 TaxID=3148887 RepID=UPI0031FE3418